jgi:hypothetical protein
VANAQPGRKSGVVASLLTDGRRSSEGECSIVERSRGDALSRESERINPRVDTDERQVPFPDSDEVGSGDGGPR